MQDEPERTSWDLGRWWSQVDSQTSREPQTTARLAFELADPATGDRCLLGAAGSGKTTELADVARILQACGCQTRTIRLAKAFASELSATLDRAAAQVGPAGVLLLDALDESMVPVEQASLQLQAWIERHREDGGWCCRLVMSCRSAVWPRNLESAFRRYPARPVTAPTIPSAGVEPPADPAGLCVLDLLPLDDAAIIKAATSREVDPEAFLAAVARVNAEDLTRVPLTLQFMLDLFARDHDLPRRRQELFRRTVSHLVADTPQRQEDATTPQGPPSVLEEAAERLAALLLFTGSDAVSLHGAAEAGTLDTRQLPTISSPSLSDPRFLRCLASTPLFTARGPGAFAFVHRQLAEHLAGRCAARLLLHQAQSLLRSEGGIAGPLRETAVAAATHSHELTDWIASVDPEVLGLSDTLDDETRRLALQAVLHTFRDGRLFTHRLIGKNMPSNLARLEHPLAARDLIAALREAPGEKDLHEVALDFIRTWRLEKCSEVLADVALDRSYPKLTRNHAAAVLADLGRPEDRKRLRPVATSDTSLDEDLRGAALGCCWPDHLTTHELAQVLTLPKCRGHWGSYRVFLFDLASHTFDRTGLVSMLRWGERIVRDAQDDDSIRKRRSDFSGDPAVRKLISSLCLQAAVYLEDADVRAAFLDLFAAAPSGYHDLLERGIGSDQAGTSDLSGFQRVLSERPTIRRLLLSETAHYQPSGRDGWVVLQDIPGLLHADDANWLFNKALELPAGATSRRSLLRTLLYLPWQDQQNCVEMWLAHLEDADIVELLGNVRATPLGGSDEARAREGHGWREPQPRVDAALDPATPEVVARTLDRVEAKIHLWPHRLLPALQLGETVGKCGPFTCVTHSPAWPLLDEDTRGRVVDVAAAWLKANPEAPEDGRDALSTIHALNHRATVLLLAERCPEALRQKSAAWWADWCSFITLNVSLTLHNEDRDAKEWLVRELHARAPRSFRPQLCFLAGTDEGEGAIDALLDVLRPQADVRLDAMLRRLLRDGKVAAACLKPVMCFLLRRRPQAVVPLLIEKMENPLADDETRKRAAETLLAVRPKDAWPNIMAFAASSALLARSAVGRFALGRRWDRGASSESLSVQEMGELLEVVMRLFPPNEDQAHDGEAFFVDAHEAGVDLRRDLVNHLAEEGSQEAVEVLRGLEQTADSRMRSTFAYARARAEEVRKDAAGSFPSAHEVAELLGRNSRMLLRSEQDVVDGVCAALDAYGRKLQQSPLRSVNDLWDDGPDGQASPKNEEHLSDKLADVVEAYFANHATSVTREAQLNRALIRRSAGGVLGSRLDLLVEVPAIGAVAGRRLRVIVEVKGSWNPSVRNAMREQLADRYLSDLGGGFGVFVVGFFDAPNLRPQKQPHWLNLKEARHDLETQATKIKQDTEGRIRVTPVVLDVTRR